MGDEEWLAALYPDIVAAGDLAAVVRRAVPGHDLADLVVGDQKWSAVVRRGDRHAGVGPALEVRLFFFTLSQHGVVLLSAANSDIGAVGGAMGMWVGGATVSQVGEAYPFIPISDWARAYEEDRAVEFEWERLLDGQRPISTYPRPPVVRRYPLVEAMLEAAAREPVLRQLYPHLEHDCLSFSRCTGSPSAGVGPSILIEPGGAYRVFHGGLEPVLSDDLTVDEAVREVVSRMPPGCGPAIQGTAADVG